MANEAADSNVVVHQSDSLVDQAAQVRMFQMRISNSNLLFFLGNERCGNNFGN